MNKWNDDIQQGQGGSAKALFWIGIILCVCFALPLLSNFKKTSFASIDSKLNPNTANVYQLAELPSIGPARADAIAEYRKGKVNAFGNATDLEKVKGIGEKTAEKIKPWLKFND